MHNNDREGIQRYSSYYQEAAKRFSIDPHELENYEDLKIEDINLQQLFSNFFQLSVPCCNAYRFNGFLLYARSNRYDERGTMKTGYTLRLRPSYDIKEEYVTIFSEQYRATQPDGSRVWDFERISQNDHGFPSLYPYIAYLSDFIHGEVQRKNYEEEKAKEAEKERFYEKAYQFFKELEGN